MVVWRPELLVGWYSPRAAVVKEMYLRRVFWFVAGVLALLLALIGIFLPLLPTAPFVLVAAACFARSSARCERWILEHPLFGPMVRDWRANRAVPLRAKQFATVMMAVSSISSALIVPPPLGLIPGICCAAVAIWLWRLPTAQRRN